MFRGYYTLTSGILSESRNIGVSANNLANISTPGYKTDDMILTNFGDEMAAIGANNKTGYSSEIGNYGSIIIPDTTITSFTQGNIDETGAFTDFAIFGAGFFAVQGEGENAEVMYTRNGSFSIDTTGTLTLQGGGPVVGRNGTIQLENDRFEVDKVGNIFDEFGNFIDQVMVYEFENHDELVKVQEGFFQSPEEPIENEGHAIIWKSVETSNVDVAAEMADMIQSQSAIQGAAQILKIYDELAGKAFTQLGGS